MALQKNHKNSKIWELRTVLTEKLSLMPANRNARTLIWGDSGGDSSDVGEDNAESHDDFIFVVITSKHSLILPIMPVISLTDLCQDCPLKSSFLRLIFSLWDFADVSVFWHWMFPMLLCLVCSEILSEGGLWTGTTIALMFHICCEHTNCSQDSGIRGSIKLIEITGSGLLFVQITLEGMERQRNCYPEDWPPSHGGVETRPVKTRTLSVMSSCHPTLSCHRPPHILVSL